MASSGEVNVVFFMEEVQKYDCIYNKYSKSYKDKYIKMNCWAKIDEKFHMSAADAEKKLKISGLVIWRNLSGFLRDLAGMLFPYPKILQALTGSNNI